MKGRGHKDSKTVKDRQRRERDKGRQMDKARQGRRGRDKDETGRPTDGKRQHRQKARQRLWHDRGTKTKRSSLYPIAVPTEISTVSWEKKTKTILAAAFSYLAAGKDSAASHGDCVFSWHVAATKKKKKKNRKKERRKEKRY